MKRFFVICFLAIFAIGLDKEIDWSKVRPGRFNISSIFKHKTCKAHFPEKIVGGEEAVPHSFPYQVGLLIEHSESFGWCGGSLISKEYVLTAAHCSIDNEGATVFLGSHNIRKLADGELRIRVPKTNFIIHEKFGATEVADDIALIKLPDPVELTKNIQLLDLPPRSLPSLVGKLVTASGWGKTSDNILKLEPVLRFVEIKVIDQMECKQYFQSLIEETHLCTSGKDGKSPCFGDSGGPIVIKESDGSIIIVGLVSFGSEFGCEFGWPAVYTRITSYLDWISRHTGITIKD